MEGQTGGRKSGLLISYFHLYHVIEKQNYTGMKETPYEYQYVENTDSDSFRCCENGLGM